MTAVLVELADLETIVHATGVIKTIEGALASRRSDPFVRAHLDYTAAHDRLATAMRNATRAEAGTVVPFDEPLTKTEIKAMGYVLEAVDAKKAALPYFVISAEDKAAPGERMSIYDRLAAKGCIRIGQAVTGVVWAGEAAADLKADPERGYLATITDRGRAMLTAAKGKGDGLTVLAAG